MNQIKILSCIACCTITMASAQNNANIKEDFKPSVVNQQGKEFPQVNSQARVRARISAPQATKVQLDLGGVKYDMVKDEEGLWTGVSEPQEEGFHYYQLNIDGASVPDPGTNYFYGAGRSGSAIEIPAVDQDFYAVKNVPHGLLSENIYYSKLTDSFRRCYVYTPPSYHQEPNKRFPVLYLQHGSFEDETGWAVQGKANLIVDNLIADKKATPMIIVIDNGYAYKPQTAAEKANKARPVSVFEEVIVQEVIPMIDAKFRTLNTRDNRAIAGLSMGANQTVRIFMNHLDKFSYYGGFSGTANYPSSDVIDGNTYLDGKFKDAKTLNQKVKLFWLGIGTTEQVPFPQSIGAFKNMLDKQGIHYEFYESKNTGHEWLTWRRSLNQFASKIFK